MALSDSEIPYISVVAVARGGNTNTLRAFVESWTRRAAGCGVSSELILVAYGALDSAPDGVRVIEVPAGVPEMKARNAGIRRARGEFILSTEIDTECSDELMQFLASRRLQRSRLYRVDRRDDRLHAREGSFRLTLDGLRENEAQDIAGIQSGVHFGAGWFPPERDAETGEVFRWIENAAEVTLRVPGNGGELTLEFEPGPGVGPLPQVLQAIDEAGDVAAEWTVFGRVSVKLWVPQGTPGTMQSFRLSVPNGGRALLDDLRILNFRCFRCDWAAVRNAVGPGRSYAGMRATLTRLLLTGGLPRLAQVVRQLRGVGDDVFGAGIAYWGQGWHRLEESGMEKFRWVSTDAELVVRSDGGQQVLSLLIEPGPSLHRQPFDLLVRLAGGKSIGRVRVSGLTVVKIPIPAPPGVATALYLSPDRLGEALPGDSRVLNFRVLACSCEAAARPLPLAELAGRRNWTTVTVGEKPAGIDWAVRLQNDRFQLAEIGRPPFLHVNACDFVLMDRDSWFNLRGYPESDDTPERLNALFCHNAHCAGAQEEVLAEALRMEGAPRPDRTAIDFDADLVWLITQMRRLRAPAILNLDTWGLAGSALRETSALPTHAGGSEG